MSVAPRIKDEPMSAFVADRFTAYEKFMVRVLHRGETLVSYLADLQKLPVLFGGILVP